MRKLLEISWKRGCRTVLALALLSGWAASPSAADRIIDTTDLRGNPRYTAPRAVLAVENRTAGQPPSLAFTTFDGLFQLNPVSNTTITVLRTGESDDDAPRLPGRNIDLEVDRDGDFLLVQSLPGNHRALYRARGKLTEIISDQKPVQVFGFDNRTAIRVDSVEVTGEGATLISFTRQAGLSDKVFSQPFVGRVLLESTAPGDRPAIEPYAGGGTDVPTRQFQPAEDLFLGTGAQTKLAATSLRSFFLADRLHGISEAVQRRVVPSEGGPDLLLFNMHSLRETEPGGEFPFAQASFAFDPSGTLFYTGETVVGGVTKAVVWKRTVVAGRPQYTIVAGGGTKSIQDQPQNPLELDLTRPHVAPAAYGLYYIHDLGAVYLVDQKLAPVPAPAP